MKQFIRSALHWLADSRVARRVVESLFRTSARQRLVELDQQAVARCQKRALLGLVHRARGTRFGRDHDFRRIRTVGDFRRLVPLRTPAELWREYWQPAFPNCAGATWPGPIPYLAISAASAGPFPYVPVSAELWAAQQTAALTALAFVLHARPRARLCSGRLLLLGGGTTLHPVQGPGAAEFMETLALRQLPAALQPYALSPLAPSCPGAAEAPESRGLPNGDEHWLPAVAERCLKTSATCLAGTADRLIPLLEQVRRLSGSERLTDVWPALAAVLYASGSNAAARRALQTAVGDERVLFLEMYCRPEGTVALEDPRHGKLRLLPDHGIYFEFVPLDQVGKPRPERISAAEVEVGVPYALALSSPAGIWACLVGSVIRFESRKPPLLHIVETEKLWERALPAVSPTRREFTPPHQLAAPALHRRTTGRAAALQGTFVRSVW
jgi:hypothetical protein